MKFKKKIKFTIFILFLFISAEILVRSLLSIDLVFQYFLGNYNFYDSRSEQLRWIKKQNNKKTDTYDSFDIYDKTKGWYTKPNIRNLSVFNNKILNTNSKGLRGEIEYIVKDKTRILLFGDSFTFGDEVNDNETYPYYLDIFLKEFEVINFGIHGYGHDQMLILLKEKAKIYKPDIIILGYVYKNNFRNLMDFKDYAKPYYILRNDELILQNSPVDTPEEIINSEIFKYKLIDLLAIIYTKIRYDFEDSNH